MSANIRLTQALVAEYQQLFNSCRVKPYRQQAVRHLVQRINQQQRRYLLVERDTTVPWQVTRSL